jgi:hypothetical protein
MTGFTLETRKTIVEKLTTSVYIYGSEVEYDCTRKLLSILTQVSATDTYYGEIGIYKTGSYYPLVYLTSANGYVYPISTLPEIIAQNDEVIYLLIKGLTGGEILTTTFLYSDKKVR